MNIKHEVDKKHESIMADYSELLDQIDIEEKKIKVQQVETNTARWNCFMCKLNFSKKRELDRHHCTGGSLLGRPGYIHKVATEKPIKKRKENRDPKLAKRIKASILKSVKPEGLFRCVQCEFVTTTSKVLKRHLATHKKSSEKNQCVTCRLVLPTLTELISHSAVHRPAQTFSCRFCSYTAPHHWMQRQHTDEQHPEKLTERPTGKKKPFRCSLCNYSCLNASTLRSHELRHVSYRPYKCPACEYTCAQLSSLKRHALVHTQQRPHRCGICRASFNHSTTLKQHMSVHSEVKPFACETCGAAFSRPHSLREHKHTHTGDKRFACDMCNYTCSLASSLRRHRQSHSRTKLHCCPDCPFACKLLETFLGHRARLHGITGLYVCPLCAHASDTPRQRSNHLRGHKPSDAPRATASQANIKAVYKTSSLSKKVKLEKKRKNTTKIQLTKPEKVMLKQKKPKIKKLKILENGSKISPKKFVIPANLLDIKVVCKRLTISEIIRCRLNP